MRKKVVIFGAGVSGLTVAHELSKLNSQGRAQFDIEIYEKNDEIGGLARSGSCEYGPTEYSWRGFYGFYEHLPNLLKEISDELSPQLASAPQDVRAARMSTVFDHFIDYNHINFSSKPLFSWGIISGLTSCTERLIHDDNKWSEVSASNESLAGIMGPWLGLDKKKASFYSVVSVGIEQDYMTGKKCKVNAGPTSQIWFDKWHRQLSEQGVKFFMKHEMVGLSSQPTPVRIQHTQLTSKPYVKNIDTNVVFDVEADYYVFALPFYTLLQVPQLFTDTQLKNLEVLCKTALQTQLGVQLYFNRKVNFPNKNGFFLTDSKWDLAVLVWDNTYEPKFLEKNQGHSIWSITVCYAYEPGFNGKTLEESTYQEIVEEIWTQLTESKLLRQYMSTQPRAHRGNIKYNFLDKSFIRGWSPLWPGMEIYNSVPPYPCSPNRSPNSKLLNHEPISTNNYGTLHLRPSLYTKYNNCFVANGFIKETIDIFSMEGAVVAGKNAVRCITGLNSKNNSVQLIQKPHRPLLFAPLRFLDSICFSFGLPNMWFLWIILMIVIIYYLARSFF